MISFCSRLMCQHVNNNYLLKVSCHHVLPTTLEVMVNLLNLYGNGIGAKEPKINPSTESILPIQYVPSAGKKTPPT